MSITKLMQKLLNAFIMMKREYMSSRLSLRSFVKEKYRNVSEENNSQEPLSYKTKERLHMSELIKSDIAYKEWITGISREFKKSQIRAAIKVNEEMLRFYWKL